MEKHVVKVMARIGEIYIDTNEILMLMPYRRADEEKKEETVGATIVFNNGHSVNLSGVQTSDIATAIAQANLQANQAVKPRGRK